MECMIVLRKLYVFDMDGTLLPNTSGCREIAKITGTKDLVERLESGFDGTKASCVKFARELYRNWGVLDHTILKSAFNNSPKLSPAPRTDAHSQAWKSLGFIALAPASIRIARSMRA